jgi:diguanylate cyclase (GGDEF)-like protein
MDQHLVLVADRNASFLEKTAQILRGVGIRMVGSASGTQALELCRQERPRLALLHVDLPGIPGVECCKRIKTEVDESLPVVLMFAEETPRAETIARECRADNYLFRPIKRTELLFCLRAMSPRPRAAENGEAAQAEQATLGRPLTGMVAREMFDTFLTIELRRVDRYGFPLSVLSIAIDPLPEDTGAWRKLLDEQLGPALGAVVRSCLRDIDLSTASAPREMLVLMPHTDREGAILVGQRVCDAVAAQSYHFGRARIRPTASVGGGCVHGERSTPRDVMARLAASRARAADAGGNQVFAG